MITITATFPAQEYIDMLAIQKGYQEKVMTQVEKEVSFEAFTGIDGIEIPAGTRIETTMKESANPQSKEDFLRQVYEGIIMADATREIITFGNKMKEEARIAEENAIRDAVASSITSKVE